MEPRSVHRIHAADTETHSLSAELCASNVVLPEIWLMKKTTVLHKSAGAFLTRSDAECLLLLQLLRALFSEKSAVFAQRTLILSSLDRKTPDEIFAQTRRVSLLVFVVEAGIRQKLSIT